MKRILQCRWLFGWSIVFILLFPTIIFADGEGNVGFDIQTEPSEFQYDKGKSYFDLRLKPEQETILTVQVNNTSSEDSTYEVSVNQAYTNDQGFIDYQEAKKSAKISTPIIMNDIITYEKKLK